MSQCHHNRLASHCGYCIEANQQKEQAVESLRTENARLTALLAAKDKALRNFALVEDECALHHDGTICCLKEAGVSRECMEILALAPAKPAKVKP